MGRKGKRKQGRAPNGDVSNGVCLAIMALCYITGGNALDIACVYKVNRSLVYECVWLVVNAINTTKKLDIKFPTQHNEQMELAKEFKARSSIHLNNCAGCVDGVLIWILKSSAQELQTSGIGGKKFFCGREKSLV
jgi:hypothetical protein